MASHRLPRRTRVYDANYNIGQSYYKPALDNLDRKYYGRTADSAPPAPRVNFDLEDKIEDDLRSARTRAARAIAEDTVFDSRGIRARKGAPISSAFDDDIDDDVRQSLTRIKAAKKQIAATINDYEAEDSFTSMRRRGGESARKFLDIDGEDDFKIKSRPRKILDTDGEEDFKPKSRIRRLLDGDAEEEVGRSKFRPRFADVDAEEDVGSKARSRARKAISKLDDEISSSTSALSSSFKRVAISDTVESVNSAASMRAQASKARLADINAEMNERSEKQVERERRAANLKKILAETEMEAITAN